MRRKDREVKSADEIRGILETCKVCRLGFSDQGSIYIVPMNFGAVFEEGRLVLYFHGAKEGKKLLLLRETPVVGIEMDCRHELAAGNTACQYSYYYASLIGNGRAEIVTEPDEKRRALAVIMRHQTGREFTEFDTNPKLEQAVEIIRVVAEEFSCKCHSRDES